MRRRILNVIAILSALVFVAAGTLWVRSQVLPQRLSVNRGSVEQRLTKSWGAGWISSNGGCALSWTVSVREWEDEGEWRRFVEINRRARRITLNDNPDVYPVLRASGGSWARAGFQMGRDVYDDPGRFRGRLHSVTYGVVFPYWALCLAAFPLPAVRLRRHLRTRRRLRLGLCLRCGYDLRASPGTCPECGAVTHSQPA
jgi:hypothetical protein